MSERKGHWPFDGTTVLAPMEGISHPAFRQVMVDMGGLGLVCTEFVRITASPMGKKQVARTVVKAGNVPLSVQVMGNDALRMGEAAQLVEEAGADVVDINLGCPMPRIVRKGVGAAMLKDLVLLQKVLSHMRANTKGLLSAKIRAGFDDSDNVLQTARVVADCGVDYIAVHPRRRCDFYRGVADWRIIALLKQHLSIPVIGNGDVWYASAALRMQAETGCDAVMIGRPALRNPWIFQQIASLKAGEAPVHPDGADLFAYIRTLIRHYEEVFEGRKMGLVGPLKEMLTWHARAIPNGRALFNDTLRLQSVDAILEQIEPRLCQLKAHELDLDAQGSLGLEQPGSTMAATDPAVSLSA
jgi:tRNA-dihydrouridine synthase B